MGYGENADVTRRTKAVEPLAMFLWRNLEVHRIIRMK